MNGHAIAHRTLAFEVEGKVRTVDIRIFAPEPDAAGGWLCPYEMDWPDGSRRNEVKGADAVEALLGACTTIGAELYTSRYHTDRKILPQDESWLGYGFPVPNALRDQLIGEDAEYL